MTILPRCGLDGVLDADWLMKTPVSPGDEDGDDADGDGDGLHPLREASGRGSGPGLRGGPHGAGRPQLHRPGEALRPLQDAGGAARRTAFIYQPPEAEFTLYVLK